MTRNRADTPARPASAGTRAAEALRAPWRRTVFSGGGGGRPEDMTPLDAIAALWDLHWRIVSLLRAEDTRAGRSCHPRSPGVTAVAEEISVLLRTADHRLRDLFGEERPGTEMTTGPESGLVPQVGIRSAVLVSLTGNITALVATINGATARDWECARPGGGPTANQVVWETVRSMTHILKGRDVALDNAAESMS